MKSNTVKQLSLCLILVVSSLFAKTQTVSCYFPAEYTADIGSTLVVEVKVDSFNNVGGMEFSIKWNPDMLSYKQTGNLGVTFNEFSGFNEAKIDEGKLGLSWISPSAVEGITLPDSTTLFSIEFDVIGTTDDTTSLQFSDDPRTREFFTTAGVVIPSIYRNGFVTLTGTSGTSYNSAPDLINLYPPTPNPFYENTFIKIDLRQAAQTNIKIVDQMGKVLHDEQQYLSAGLQTIPVSKDIFSHSGTYYCLLYANDFRVMQKLVFIDR
jgi:hypothetical protein